MFETKQSDEQLNGTRERGTHLNLIVCMRARARARASMWACPGWVPVQISSKFQNIHKSRSKEWQRRMRALGPTSRYHLEEQSLAWKHSPEVKKERCKEELK